MSPYKSFAQERFFHSNGAKKAGIKPSTVKEFDRASKDLKLPERVNSHKEPQDDLPATGRHFQSLVKKLRK